MIKYQYEKVGRWKNRPTFFFFSSLYRRNKSFIINVENKRSNNIKWKMKVTVVKKNDSRLKDGYKWFIVGLCFLMIFVCLGFCSSTKSLYLAPMTEALGIKRSAFSVGDSIRCISIAVVNMFFGILVRKFGTKKLIIAGFICLISASVIYSLAENLIWIYISGALLGVGFSWTTTSMVGCIVNRWCSEKRGTVMGAVLAANGVGGAVATQILSPIIYRDGNPFGYREAYLLTAILLAVTLIIVLIFYKEKEPDIFLYEQKEQPAEKPWIGVDIKNAKKNVYFYCTVICVFFTGMVMQGILWSSAAHMKDVGIDTGFIATVISIHSVLSFVSKLVMGTMYDKFGLRITVLICDIAAALSLITLAVLNNSRIGMMIAALYAVFSAFALPLDTVMLPVFASDLFGLRSYEQILGIFVAANNMGYAIGVPLMNLIFDVTGSYKPMLMVLSGVMILVILIFQLVINKSKKWKEG